MALATKAIKTKIRSVRNIKKITKAMEMVAASKMKKMTERAVATRGFAALALELMINIGRAAQTTHPLLLPGIGNKELVLLIASNRGLCGGFNITIAKALAHYLKEQSGGPVEVVTVGRYAERIARRLGLKVVGSFIGLPENIHESDAKPVAALILHEFGRGGYEKVTIAYNGFVSPLVYRPIVRGLLPLKEENIRRSIEELGEVAKNKPFRSESMAQYIFEPGEEAVLNAVLPKLTEVVMYQAILESLASEHSSRMVAMKNASENADKLTDDLVVGFNQARQAAITQEIAEIVGGANA